MQESVGIAKALAAKNGYELDSNQEVYFFLKFIYVFNSMMVAVLDKYIQSSYAPQKSD